MTGATLNAARDAMDMEGLREDNTPSRWRKRGRACAPSFRMARE